MIRKVVLFMLFALVVSGFCADSKTYTLLEFRFFEGFRDQSDPPEFIVHTVELDPGAAKARENEERSISDIFQLDRVRYLSSLELWLPALVREAQRHQVTIHERQLSLSFEPLSGQSDRFRLIVSLDPPQVPKTEILLDTVVILPQQKGAVLGFKDNRKQIYFISLGRKKNVELGYDRIIDGKAVRFPRLLKMVSPDYPLSVLKKGVEGMVVVEGTTDTQGRPIDAKILVGPEDLGDEVIKAVRQWVYRPMNVDGVNEPTRFLSVCHFFIRESGQEMPAQETLYASFDQFWGQHVKSAWPDPKVEGAVSVGINQRLIEMLIIEGRREGP